MVSQPEWEVAQLAPYHDAEVEELIGLLEGKPLEASSDD